MKKKNRKVMLNLILFGPPGSGKGTQAEKLIAKYNLFHISTGDMFRYELSNNTELGQLARSYMDKGQLVPDSVTISMLKKRVEDNPDVKGFIFDGFPRTVPQAEALDIFLEGKGEKIDLVVQLDVNGEEIKARIAERQNVSGRADDAADKLIKRIDEYFEKTIHVLPYYEAQGKAVKVNGIGRIDEIFNKVCNKIDAIK